MLILSASPGSVILDNQTVGPSIFATAGSSTSFLQYYISNDTWITRANTLASVGLGGGARHTGLGNISALRGSKTNTFWNYNISSNTWSTRAVLLGKVNTGGTLSDYIRSGNIAALKGDGTNTFWIYNISSDTWSGMANAPGNVGAGGALAFIGSGNISALRGAASSEFWIYNISRDNWSRMANTPGIVGAGEHWLLITGIMFTRSMERIHGISGDIISPQTHGLHWQQYRGTWVQGGPWYPIPEIIFTLLMVLQNLPSGDMRLPLTAGVMLRLPTRH